MPTRSPATTCSGVPQFKSRFIIGGAAGDLTVTGIGAYDQLLFVGGIKSDGSAVKADLTSEFTITADNTINNVGGTDTSSYNLLVHWWNRPSQLG